MHRGLPLVESIESVSFNSSESGFGTSVNSAMLVELHATHSWIPSSHSLSFIMLTWTLKISPSGSWMSLYVLSTSDIISICNAVVGISEVLEYCFPSLKNWYSTKPKSRKHYFTFYSLGSHLRSKSEHNLVHNRNGWFSKSC